MLLRVWARFLRKCCPRCCVAIFTQQPPTLLRSTDLPALAWGHIPPRPKIVLKPSSITSLRSQVKSGFVPLLLIQHSTFFNDLTCLRDVANCPAECSTFYIFFSCFSGFIYFVPLVPAFPFYWNWIQAYTSRGTCPKTPGRASPVKSPCHERQTGLGACFRLKGTEETHQLNTAHGPSLGLNESRGTQPKRTLRE